MKATTLAPPAAAHLGDCPRCQVLEEELETLRQERMDLLVEVRRLERQSAVSQRRPTPLQLPPVRPEVPSVTRLRDSSLPTIPTAKTTPRLFDNASVVQRADAGIDVGSIRRLDPKKLDDLPYGLIVLDAQGRVVRYNDTESRLAGLPPERVIGRDFFREVAPCTRVREFEGRFRELVADPHGVKVQTFDFVFRFEHSEQQVSIVIVPARRRGHYNMALVRRSIATG
ncbi:MAG: PAS domain-containing protein [Myxococcota bacterium]